MKKFFYPLLLMMAMTVTFISCDDDDVTIPALSVEVPGLEADGDVEVATGDTLVFKAKDINSPITLLHWYVNGEKVSEGPTYKFVSNKVGEFKVTLKATSVDGGVAVKEFEVEVYGKYKKGTFVLSEGNFSDQNGKLTFISPKGVVTDSAYFKVNGSFLGHSTQDLCIEDGKMYIISQDNKLNGDGILVVVNAETLVKEAAYTQELASLSNPTHVLVEDRLAYIRDNRGVHTFNLDTKELKLVEEGNMAKNRMAEVEDNIYVISNDHLLSLNNGKVARSISMGGKISGIVAGDNDVLWVALDKKPAEIVKMDGKTGSVLSTNVLESEYGLNAGWGATPSIGAKGDTLYFSNNTTTIYRHIFGQKKTEKMVNTADYIEDAKMLYNNIGVDPENGDVYMTTIKGYGNDYKMNNITVFNFDKQKVPVANYQNHTSFPAGVFFTESF